MERLAAILSEWIPDSTVSRVNERAGIEPAGVPRELWEVLEAAQEASTLTSGAFDATWAALGDLWRFDCNAPHIPPSGEVNRRRQLVGYRDLVLDSTARTAFLKRRGMRVGLGGLAKGDIVQAAADLLVSRNVPNVLVAVSGGITARGRNGDRPWKVAVRDPRRRSGVLATVELHDESVSTAGDYERFFTIDGHRYHHILDPKTGYPAIGTQSVTVIAPRGVVAALDTGLFGVGIGAWQPGRRISSGCGGAPRGRCGKAPLVQRSRGKVFARANRGELIGLSLVTLSAMRASPKKLERSSDENTLPPITTCARSPLYRRLRGRRALPSKRATDEGWRPRSAPAPIPERA